MNNNKVTTQTDSNRNQNVSLPSQVHLSRSLFRVALLTAALPVCSAYAGLDVFSVGGNSTASSIQSGVAAFRAALGNPVNGNAPGPLEAGRREINWDGGGATGSSAAGPVFTGFLNTRGATFFTPGTGFLQTPVTDPALTGLNPTYAAAFRAFSPLRIFTAVNSTITDVTFSIPGSNGAVSATVAGFGAIFSDVDLPDTTSLEFFNSSGRSLDVIYAQPGTVANGSFSFLGAVANAGEAIARVRITSGNTALGPTDANGGSVDVVVMDDFIYSEPAINPGPTDLETVADFVDALPNNAFKARGHRTAILSILADIQDAIDSDQTEEAIRKLESLRRKFSGCDDSVRERAAASDWITNCDAQRELRGLIDDLLTLL